MYTIKEAASRSGLSVATVRVWEGRYGIVRPERTPAGYRLYDDAAISRLIAMRHLVEHEGMRPSQAAVELLADGTDIASLIRDADARDREPGRDAPSVATDVDGGSRADGQVAAFVAAARDLDLATMDRILDETFAAERFEPAMQHVVFPALRAVGTGWSDGSIDVAMEHAASEMVRRRLARFFEMVSRSGNPAILVGLPPGGQHEIGALAFAVAARRAGLSILYLGANVPTWSWVIAAESTRADVAVVGVVGAADVAAAAEVVRALHQQTRDVAVVLGGARAGEVPGQTTPVLPDSLDDAVAAVRRLAG